MRLKSKVLAAVLTVVLSLGVAALAGAAGDLKYPTKSIELICSMSPGGDSDFNARALAKYLTIELGQNVVVTNITGGGSSVATDEFVHSKNDGYRLYMNHAPLHTATAFGISEFAWYDMDPVCIFGRGTGEVLTVHGNNPAKNLKELIELSQKEPGKYKFAYNAGATSHYVAVKLALAGAKFNNVTTGSAADRVVGLKGGHIDVMQAGIPMVEDYVKTGEFKYFCNMSTARAALYPDVPTAMDQGFDIGFDPAYSLYAVKGTDPAIIAKLEAACKKIVLENKEYQADIKKAFAQAPYFLGTEDARADLKKQLDRYMEIKDELRAGFKK